MTFPFNAARGLIIVRAELYGPSGSVVLRLALDTGASTTLINVAPLITAGYDPGLVGQRVQVTTGSAVESVPRFEIERLNALGHNRIELQILGHTLPPSSGIDGLLGLDFLRGHLLSIDFQEGHVTLQ